jgi:fructose-bisphosphate aldolase class II
VDTDNRLAMTGAIRKVFWEKPEEFDPRKYMGPARDAMNKVCVAHMTAFGQAGQASKIKAKSMAEMAKLYK